jgi:hypothetical protein
VSDIFRVTGTASEVGARTGTAKTTGKPYSIPFLTVTMNDFCHTTVNLADSLVDKIAVGDVVDLIVDVSVAGGYLRAQAQAYWPTEAYAA